MNKNLKNFSKFTLIGVLFSLITGSAYSGSVTLYRPRQNPQLVSVDFQLPAASLSGKKLNQALVSSSLRDFLGSNRVDVNLLAGGVFSTDDSNLQLAKSIRDEAGISIRLRQRQSRVSIEGAEVVALFDLKGNLKSLNSSLVAKMPISIEPQLSETEAKRIAERSLGIKDARYADSLNDGLLIVDAPKAPKLVWQFTLASDSDLSNGAKIQILASGANAGNVHRTISLAHTLNANPNADIEIYDSSVTIVLPNPIYKGIKVLDNGEPTFASHIFDLTNANAVHKNLSAVLDFYKVNYGRSSYDNKKAELVAAVNVQKFKFFDILGEQQNAAWVGPFKMFVFGAGGDKLAGFAQALDVVGHEYTHAVIEKTSNLAYEGQSGALNEHLADVFGVMVRHATKNSSSLTDDNGDEEFLIGATTLRGEFKKKAKALRDMLHPDKGLMPQPGKVSEIEPEFGPSCSPTGGNDQCGVHTLSGVPNKVVANIIKTLGWEKPKKLFYRVMTARLRSKSDFKDYRQQVLAECEATLSVSECAVVKTAFSDSGVE